MGYICKMDKKYYVYGHFKRGENNPFYIGKGCGNRAYATGNRSKFWKRIANKYGYEARILIENLSEEVAYQIEMEFIATYKSIGSCEANFTMGGDGVRVEKRWWYDKISASMKGRKRPSGKDSKSYKDKITKEQLYDLYVNKGMSSIKIGKLVGISYATVCTRLKQYGIKAKQKGKIGVPIICVNDGKQFNSITDAAKHYNVYRENIRKVLKGIYKHTNKLKFIYGKQQNNQSETIGFSK